jgi:hypothetical protein
METCLRHSLFVLKEIMEELKNKTGIRTNIFGAAFGPDSRWKHLYYLMIDYSVRSYKKEILDDDDIPFADIRQNMKELNFINTYLGGHSIQLKVSKRYYLTGNRFQFVKLVVEEEII